MDADGGDGGVAEGVRSSLAPDYVVRKELLVGDVTRLLHALGCAQVEVTSMNVHEISGGGRGEGRQEGDLKGLIDGVFDQEDVRYRSIMRIAARNEEGLRRARLFTR